MFGSHKIPGTPGLKVDLLGKTAIKSTASYYMLALILTSAVEF